MVQGALESLDRLEERNHLSRFRILMFQVQCVKARAWLIEACSDPSNLVTRVPPSSVHRVSETNLRSSLPMHYQGGPRQRRYPSPVKTRRLESLNAVSLHSRQTYRSPQKNCLVNPPPERACCSTKATTWGGRRHTAPDELLNRFCCSTYSLCFL